MLLWGIASTGMMFVSRVAFLRAALPARRVRSGLLSGIVLYLTYWFPANRRAAAISVFFAGVAVAGVLGGLMSGWIMRDMSGVLGLHGWQWMFAIEGAPAILLAFAAFTLLVDRPQDATWLTPDEKARVAALCADGRGHGHARRRKPRGRACEPARVPVRVHLFLADLRVADAQLLDAADDPRLRRDRRRGREPVRSCRTRSVRWG